MMRRLLVPFSVLCLVWLVHGGQVLEVPPTQRLLLIFRVTCVLAFLLAWRFHRGRLAAAVAMVAGLGELMAGELAGIDRSAPLLAWCLFAVPLNFIVFTRLKDWRVISAAGALRWAFLGLQVAVLWSLAGLPNDSIQKLLTSESFQANPAGPWLAPVLGNLPTLPVATAVAFALALAWIAHQFHRQRTAFEAGLLGALLALGATAALLGSIPLTLPKPETPPLLHLVAAALILGLALVEGAFSLAFEDGLTGLPARRALEESLRHLGRTYTIGMVDIDHFKKLNDRHGHEVGDQVLRMVAGILAGVGGGGKAYRYGGEEFTVLFPGKGVEDAEPHLEELRRTIAGRRFKVRSPGRPKKKPKGGKAAKGGPVTKELKATVSIGLAEREERWSKPDEVIKAADKALYRAKKGGRNRVIAS